MTLTVSALRPDLANFPEYYSKPKDRKEANDVWVNHLLMPPPTRAAIGATAKILLVWIAAIEVARGVFRLIGEHVAPCSILAEGRTTSQEDYGCNQNEPHGLEYTP